MHREVTARAPARIDLGGGWTDVPPYADREGGFVCNIAITRYAVARVRQGAGRIESAMLRAVMRRTGSRDVSVELTSDFPTGAGLGGSSSASAAVLGALEMWHGRPVNRATIAEEGRRVEVEELGIAGGRQDHYAATHGGALGLTFSTGVSVQRIPLPASTRRDFLASCTLIYTGESRISGDTITAVLGAYEAGDPRILEALQRMKELAVDMCHALGTGDLHALGEMVGEHWEYQRSLHPSIPTARIDDIVDRARRAGALGSKAMGASGGGCVLVLSRPGTTAAVRHALRGCGDIMEFAIDDEGLLVTESST